MRDDDNDFTLRPEKILHRGGGQLKSFFKEVMRSLRKQGGGKTSAGSTSGKILGGRSTFGRGRNAYGRSLFSGTSRRVAIKARIARHQGKAFRSAPMAKHMVYLKREGVTRDEGRAVMFDAEGDHANEEVFVERCAEDRHHFRFIISPEDAAEMEYIRAFTRDLARQMQDDLETKLDGVAVEHWKTEMFFGLGHSC